MISESKSMLTIHFSSQPSMFQQMAATAGGVAVGSAIVSLLLYIFTTFHSKKCHSNKFTCFFILFVGTHGWTRSHGDVLRWKRFKRGSTSSCRSASIPTAGLSTTTTTREWPMFVGNQAILRMCWKPN